MTTCCDMKRDPACLEADLGRPMPDSPHAVSVALPLWSHAVAYEEKDPAVVARMQLGYPRFVIHPLVRQLVEAHDGSVPCLPLPSRRAAERCMAFITEKSGAESSIVESQGLFFVKTTAEGEKALRLYWQHTGQIVSSRQAEAVLAGRGPAADAEDACTTLRQRLADLYQCTPDDVFLYPTGMAAVDAAAQTVRALNPGRQTAQVGFPYIDSLKLQQEFGKGAQFILSGNDAVPHLQPLLDKEALAGVFCEIPSNPLLLTPDVIGISKALRERGIPFVVDDAVATPCNVDVTPYADLVVTSLTKYFSGTGNVMGGALICCPSSPLHAALRAACGADYEPLLWGDDAIALECQSRNFPERMQVHNTNGDIIANRLRQDPRVENVCYPRWDPSGNYDALRRQGGGYSSLLSILLKDAPHSAPRFYDALHLCKGPTLGTEFTLVCPYTLLAHYKELAWAESCGVSRYLVRVSVGIEEPESIWDRFQSALDSLT
jgi:cystathionine gamma-synthase